MTEAPCHTDGPARADYVATQANRRRPRRADGYKMRPCGPTPADLRVLWRLMRSLGRIVTHDALIAELYDDREDGGPATAPDVVKGCIWSLNWFLSEHNGGCRVIESLRGIGYRMPRAVNVPEEWQPPIDAPAPRC